MSIRLKPHTLGPRRLTTKRIIVLLLMMVVFFPMFDEPQSLSLMTPQDDEYKEKVLYLLHDQRPRGNVTGSAFCREKPRDIFCLNLREWVTKAGKLRYLRIGSASYDDWLRELFFHTQGKGALNAQFLYEHDDDDYKDVVGKRESEKRPYGKENKACEVQPCKHYMRWNPRRDLARNAAREKHHFSLFLLFNQRHTTARTSPRWK